MGWIAVDLDGTLAGWGGEHPTDVLRIGPPIPVMVDRVKGWIAEGKDVRIFTARVGPADEGECLGALQDLTREHCEAVEAPWPPPGHPVTFWQRYQRALIDTWCRTHLGRTLPITATKDFHLWQLWDDRCMQIVPNTGLTVIEHALLQATL